MNSQKQGMKNGQSVLSLRRKVLYCLTFLLILILIYYGLFFVLQGPQTPNPQIIAHRGGPVYNPENTMKAFQAAIESGVDWIEFDVQRSHDNVLVVIHDETVDRTTNGIGPVGQMTLEQIQALDAGEGEQVPTFKQVIEMAKQKDIGILPEAKSPELYPGLAEEILKVVEIEDYLDRTVLQSFDWDSLVAVRQQNPALAVCPLSGLWQFDLSNLQPNDAEIICPMAEMVLLYPWMIQQAQREGREVFVWFGVIESPLMMRLMLAMNADGLIVDDPAALAEILALKSE